MGGSVLGGSCKKTFYFWDNKYMAQDRKFDSGDTEKAATMASSQRSRCVEGQGSAEASLWLWGLLQQNQRRGSNSLW